MSPLAMTALLLPALAASALPASQGAVVVVSESGVDAYTEAVDGVSAVLSGGGFRVMDAGGMAGALDSALEGALGNKDTRLVIAVGSRALSSVRARHIAVPVETVMVLAGGEPDSAAGHVDLAIPLAAQLGAMRAIWPGRRRAGIIRNPAQPRWAAEVLEACARHEGFLPLVVDCLGPAHLLKALATLKGKVDFVLCFPDPDLYNPVTIKPLVLASLEHGLPLVGFSPAFVRAGAAAGIFPDYRDLGRQAGEMALRLLRGEERAADESPRKIQVAINQRVDRLLGVEFRAGALGAEVFR
jgi:putative ABC transport system substrate-binding protein